MAGEKPGDFVHGFLSWQVLFCARLAHSAPGLNGKRSSTMPGKKQGQQGPQDPKNQQGKQAKQSEQGKQAKQPTKK